MRTPTRWEGSRATRGSSGRPRRWRRWGAPASTGFAEFDSGLKSAEEAMAGATVRVRLNLESYLSFLGTVGNNAPFVGLFGTVIGIIQAFDKLRAGETAARDSARRAAQAGGAMAPTLDTGAVMGTLAEALVATAIGLLVAIPAVAAFNYFQRRIKSMLTDTEALTQLVLAYAHAPTQAVHPAPARIHGHAEIVPVAEAS